MLFVCLVAWESQPNWGKPNTFSSRKGPGQTAQAVGGLSFLEVDRMSLVEAVRTFPAGLKNVFGIRCQGGSRPTPRLPKEPESGLA